MALDTYADLQAEATDWMERAGQSGKAPTWIKLAEARLNRELGVLESDTTLTGVVGSRAISLSALSVIKPIALFLAEAGSDEIELTPKADGTFAYRFDNGRPVFWAMDGGEINFDCPLDAAYPFRFRYRGRFALSDAAPTNWLLTNHPDIYLAATLMWGAGYNQDWQNGSIWKATLDEAIPQVRSEIAQNKRATATVDPALSSLGRGYHWNGAD